MKTTINEKQTIIRCIDLVPVTTSNTGIKEIRKIDNVIFSWRRCVIPSNNRFFNLLPNGQVFSIMGYDFSVERLQRIISILKNEYERRPGLKTKSHIHVKKRFQVNIIDESANYFIAKSGKTYPKADYEWCEIKTNSKIAYLYKYSYYGGRKVKDSDKTWYFWDLDTGFKNTENQKLIDMVEYLIDILTIIARERKRNIDINDNE